MQKLNPVVSEMVVYIYAGTTPKTTGYDSLEDCERAQKILDEKYGR